MGVFDDKKFEELDWISQATEPIDSIINDILGKLPEELVIDYKLYMKIAVRGYGLDLEGSKVLTYLIGEYAPGHELSWDQRSALNDCFKLQMTGEEIILNFETETLTGGEIKFIKTTSTMDEKVLESMLGKEGMSAVGNMFINADGLSRANEVMEILGKCEEGLRSRSERRKRSIIVNRLREIFKNNEWKIKDTELANKVGHWIVDYVKYGNLAAWSNFCRLKVMTHKDQPIYSMEEIK